MSPSFGIGSPASVGSPGLFNSTHCSPFSKIPGPSPSNATGTRIGSEVHNVLHSNIKNTPQSAKINHVKLNPRSCVRKTAVGKNLLLSYSPNTYNNHPQSNNNQASNNFFKNVPNQNKTLDSNISSKSTNNPPSTTPFKFDPVILEPKKFSCESFPQSNSERQIKNSELAKINNCFENSKTESKMLNNSFKLVLSQSTQLTTEEQSLVESVFDGVDADSLFDDDF